MIDNLGEARTIDDAAGVAVGRIVVVGATSVKKPTADNEGNLVGVTTQEQLTQNGAVEVAEYGMTIVEVQETVVKGEYCVAGVGGYGRPESAFKSGAELNVVGVFVDSLTYVSGVAYARVRIGIGLRVRRNKETVANDTGVTAILDGVTYLDATAGDATIDLEDGVYAGQIKTVIRVDDSANTASVTVSNHLHGIGTTFELEDDCAIQFIWDDNIEVWRTLSDASKLMGLQYTNEAGDVSNTSPYFGFSLSDFGAYHMIGATGSIFGMLPCVAHVNTTGVGNVGTGEDDLQTWTVPANTLVKAKDTLRITFNYSFGGAGVKRIRAYFGGTALFDTGNFVGAAGNSAELVVKITELTFNTQQCTASWTSNSNLAAASNFSASLALDLTTNLVLKSTGVGTTDNEIVSEQLMVEYLPSPPVF